MTGRIRILSESVQHMIAAGEVVEGPFSVIKELVENALDASAKHIVIETEESGLKKILVRDDGTGIVPDDMPLVLTEHATSKIDSMSDIEKIGSFGFRGEALSSIASISRLTMLSRSDAEPRGARIFSDAESPPVITDYAGSRGTVVIVENLFFNTPARKKFLGSLTTEARRIREVCVRMALAHPAVGFEFTQNGKEVFSLDPDSSFEVRIEKLFGKDARNGLYFEKVSDIKVSVSGYVSSPEYIKSSRSMQMLFVNGRMVDYPYLGFVLSRAYDSICAKGQYPAALLFVDIDPALVDVNVHPAKRQIKFFDQRYVDDLLYALVKKALGRVHLFSPVQQSVCSAPLVPTDQSVSHQPADRPKSEETSCEDHAPLFTRDAYAGTLGISFAHKNEPASQAASAVADGKALYTYFNTTQHLRVIGTLFDTYVIAEHESSMVLIDFHAAHERLLYDELMAKDISADISELVFPMAIHLSVEEYGILADSMEYFTDMGFDVEQIGETSVIVRAVPLLAETIDAESFLRDSIESLKGSQPHAEKMRGLIAERAACHAARRAGDHISIDEAEHIAAYALDPSCDRRCPHGRPFVYTLGQADIEKLFKRS